MNFYIKKHLDWIEARVPLKQQEKEDIMIALGALAMDIANAYEKEGTAYLADSFAEDWDLDNPENLNNMEICNHCGMPKTILIQSKTQPTGAYTCLCKIKYDYEKNKKVPIL